MAQNDQQKVETQVKEYLQSLENDELIDAINSLRVIIHENSPFKENPVDMIYWVKNSDVHANDYNPNSVAPTEMDLLKLSIKADGYTQPIVTMPEDGGSFEVVDGFHRHLVGKNDSDVQQMVHGYLPVVKIRSSRYDKENRMAATVRHNRARGKHKVESMSEIVMHLKRKKWSDTKIAKHLGMDQDEVLRLRQVTGLTELFKNREFSMSWEMEDEDI